MSGELHRVVVVRRAHDWMACANGDRKRWEAGRTPEEAIGKLVLSTPRKFDPTGVLAANVRRASDVGWRLRRSGVRVELEEA